MEDYYYELQKYLSIYSLTAENEEYLQYLGNAYNYNIKCNAYQFSYISFHLLYMSYIYKTLWAIHKSNYNESSEHIKSFLSRQNIREIFTPFDFSSGPEKQAIATLSQPLHLHRNQIEKFSIPINKRDHCAHASGRIEYKETAIERLIQEEIECVEEIYSYTNDVYLSIFNEFLNENWNPENRTISLGADSINELIKIYQFSEMDMKYIVEHDFSELQRKSIKEETIYKKLLILMFIIEAQEYIDLEEDFLQKKLEQLFIGYSKEIKVDLPGIIGNEFYREKDSDVLNFLNKRLEEL